MINFHIRNLYVLEIVFAITACVQSGILPTKSVNFNVGGYFSKILSVVVTVIITSFTSVYG
jgi:hypothetical protein